MVALEFQYGMKGPQSQAGKRFWKTHLPPLQFHNPTVPMSVTCFATKGMNMSLRLKYTDKPDLELPCEHGAASVLLKALLDNGATPISESEKVEIKVEKAL